MASERSEATLQAAFLDPVRTVLIVDDEFPTYGHLAAEQRQVAGNGTKNEDNTGSADEGPESRPADVAEARSRDVEEDADAQVSLHDADEKTQPVDSFEGDGEKASRARSHLAYLRAAALWEAFRRRGWNCDVDDGSHLDPMDRRIGEVDLLILDYELNHEGPEPALRLLSSLAGAPHASLAVVYTKADDLRQVRLQVAGRLWACHPQPTDGPGVQAMKQVGDELDDAGLKVDDEVALIYLRGGGCMKTEFAKEAVKVCRGKAGIKPVDVVRGEIERYLKETFGAKDGDHGGTPPFALDGSTTRDGSFWIWCNNLFVAFVHKQNLDDNGNNEGDRVIKELLRALSDWNPDGLTMTLSFARGQITRGGFRAAADALGNRELYAALLYFANAGDHDERSDRLREFYRRLLSRFVEHILAEVAKFGLTALPGLPERTSDKGPVDLVAWAARTARIEVSSVDLFHELNKFLATDSPGSHACLGTVFVAGDGEQAEYWMCVTPACDLVPRKPSASRWEGKIDPLRPVVCMQGVKASTAQKSLTKAEQGKTIFLMLPAPEGRLTRGALRFLDEKPVLEHFYLVDRGRLDNNQCVKAYRLTKGESDAPKLQETLLRVLTQVRDLHANRFLRAAGEHASRIGVDFVDLVQGPQDA